MKFFLGGGGTLYSGITIDRKESGKSVFGFTYAYRSMSFRRAVRSVLVENLIDSSWRPGSTPPTRSEERLCGRVFVVDGLHDSQAFQFRPAVQVITLMEFGVILGISSVVFMLEEWVCLPCLATSLSDIGIAPHSTLL